MILHLAIRLLVLALLTHAACAQSNITIDDTDLSIVYAPAGAWVVSSNSTLDFGGAHILTQSPNATAIFNFTGIAIYFLSPKWPYTVNTQLSLDGAAPVLVDLIDHSRPDVLEGPETVQSAVVWSATGLNNTQHTLIISVGVGQPFGIVDGIIFTTTAAPTTSASPVPPSTSPPATSSSTSTSTSTPPPSTVTDPVVADPAPAQASQKVRVLPIVLGSLFGLIGIGVVVLALVFACRRRRRPKSEAWTIDGTLYSSSSTTGVNKNNNNNNRNYTNYTPMPASTANANANASGYPMDQTPQGAWQNTRYGYIGNTPPPPIPPQDGRAPNRYLPGATLSTITEKSTPRMGDAQASLAHSPASAQSGELPGSGYYTAPPSDAEGAAGAGTTPRRAYFGVSPGTPMPTPSGTAGVGTAAGQHGLPGYSAQAPQGRWI